MDYSRGNVYRKELDFEIPVKYGLSLGVSRVYSSGTFNTTNSNGDGMFGKQWWSSYEMCLRSYTGGYLFYDELGNYKHLTGSGGVWHSRIDQGSVMKMEQSGSDFVITRFNRDKITFDSDGRLKYYEGNADDGVTDRLEFVYDGSNRLWKVLAPNGDDRYLEFTYHWYYTRQVAGVALKTATKTYDLHTYSYYSNKSLATVEVNNTDETFYMQYEYGSFDGTTFTSGTDPKKLGRVQYYSSEMGGLQPLVAYTWGTFWSQPVVTKNYNWNPVTPAWECVSALDYSAYPMVSVAFGCNFSGTQQSNHTLNYQRFNRRTTYTNIPDVAGGYLFVPDGFTDTDQVDTPTAAGWSRTTNSTSGNPIWKKVFDWSNSDPTLKYRLTSFQQFFSTSPSVHSTTSYSYSSAFPHKLATVTYPMGETLNYTYYNEFTARKGRLATVSDGLSTTTFDYSTSTGFPTLHRVAGLTANIDTTFTYNARGQVSQITLPTAKTISYTYNDFSQVLTETHSDLGVTSYRYSDDTTLPSADRHLPARLVEIEDSQSNLVQYKYNAMGRTTEVIDQSNKSTAYDYDGRLRLIEITNPAGETMQFEYDHADRMTKFKDGRLKETNYTYDALGRVKSVTDGDSKVKNVTYSLGEGGCGTCGGAANKVARLQMQDGNYISYHYDLAGRMTGIDYENIGSSGSKEVTFTYDANSRVLSVTDSRLGLGNNAYSFAFGTPGAGTPWQLHSVSHPEGYTQEYFYNTSAPKDVLKAYRDIDGNITEYAYDSLDRLSTLTDSYGGVTSYTFATTSDSGYPVGAAKVRTFGNGAKEAYTYDVLGRLDRIDHKNSSNTVFDYIDLTYNPANLITARERKDGGSYMKAEYEYDDAYRLTAERFKTSGGTEKSRRIFAYDDAGNRESMTFWNDAGVNLTTTYAYGNREQIVSNTAYKHLGTAETGNVSYSFDDKGNMTGRTLAGPGDAWTYGWNEENRMTSVRAVNSGLSTDFLTEYKYDLYGRRVLKRASKVYSSGTPSQRTRYFFNGLTEEIKKVSVSGNGVSHTDAAFERTMKLDASEGTPSGWSDPYVAIESNSERRSDVYKFTNWTMHGTGFWVPSPDNGYNITGKKSFSCWAKALTNASEVSIYFETTSARRAIQYRASTGAPFVIGNILYIQLGGTDQDYLNDWTRIERDIEADLKTQWPSENLVRVLGCAVWTGNASYPLYVDDLSFSNSMTAEHNVLGPGVIGHILRNRSTNAATYAATDRWFHFDQVGSVSTESDNTGALAQTHWQDAFGNTLSGWQTATWGGDRPGWHHNSKEYDGDSQLVYMYQRWYTPEMGSFLSSAPFPPMMEHRFSFGVQNPPVYVDPFGLKPKDKWFGYTNRQFQRWVHGKKQGEGRRNDYCKEELDELWEEFIDEAKDKMEDRTRRNALRRGSQRGFLNLSGSANGAAGIGLAIGSGLGIGIAANRAIVSKQRQYEASSAESLNNIAEYTWSRCQASCRDSSTTGQGFAACMNACTGTETQP